MKSVTPLSSAAVLPGSIANSIWPIFNFPISFCRKIVAAVALCFIGLCANAQNISNPSFESFNTPCPTAQSQFKDKVTGWTTFTSIASGTPDYFNTCGLNLSGYTPVINPQSGTGFAGIFAELNNTITDYKEYITTQLSTPLVAGVTYKFSFYVAHIYGPSPAGFTPGTLTYTDLPVAEQGFLGAVFSTAAPAQTNTGNGSGGAPLYNSIRNDFGLGRALIPATNTNVYGVASRNIWVPVTLTYTAVGGETFMTIGQFRPGSTTVAASNAAYYLFDNFSASLIPVSTPGGVSSPDFWVKSDDAGTIATAWKDNSPNADHIPNVGGMTLSPADRAHNFHPYTTGYTGSKFFYNQATVMNPTNGELANTNTSIFSAVRPTTNGTGRITGIDDDVTYASEPGVSIANGKPRQYEYFNVTTSTDFSTAFNIGSSNVFSAIANNSVANLGTSASAGGEKRLGLNGTYETTSFTGSNKFQIYGRNLRVGQAGWDAAGPFPGDIMEVVWYKRTLTANEQSRVNSYLALKNGVTLNENYLSTSSSVVWDKTINSGYNSNIFGIARDNRTELHQKQSGSVHVGQKLVIGNSNSLSNTNADNTNDLTEGQFLIVGDNGLKQSLTTPLAYTAGVNGAANFRFESIWKVQNTGGVGNVTVAWPKGVANLYLLQSTDAVFDGSDSFTSMAAELTVNGVVYNTATVTLANGTFFTFAGFAYAPGGVAGPDFWVKSDDAGNIATAWKDNSLNADDIPNEGGIALSPADRGHNFHPYTTDYTSSKFFYNPATVMNPTNGELANTNTSIFSALRPTTNGTGRITGIDDDVTYASEPGVSIANGKPRQYEYFNVTTSTDFSTAFNIGSSNVFSAIANNSVANLGTSASAGGEKRLGLNGTYETTSFTGSNKFQIYGRNLRVGQAGWDAAGPFTGDIMEVVWYKRTLTANEQSRVNSYLALKNGVTLNENYLATSSSVVWDRTNNTGYNSNIFGIARDNITALHQKQSTSVNVSQKLVIGNGGSLFDTNAANTNTLTEGQFLIVGDNGLKQSLTVTTPLIYTAGANGATNYRFESIWKAQNTGNVGNVTVAWPKGVANLYLVQSADAVFDATDSFTSMATEVTVNGVVYNTATATLANGTFFTFAGFGNAPGGVVSGLSYWYRADKNATNTGATTDVTGWTDMWNGTTVAQLGTNALPKYAIGTSSYFNFNPGINFTAINQTIGNNSVQTIFNANNDLFMVTKEGMTSAGSPNPHFFSIGMDNNTATIDNWDYLGVWPSGQVERRVYNGGTNFPAVNPGYSTSIPSIMYYNFLNQPYSRGLNGAANGATYNSPGAMGIPLGGHIFGDSRFSSNNSDNGGFIGNIGETIIYGNGNLTTTERRKVDSYLAIKYGITLGQVATDHYLDTDGSIVWNGASNTTYNNNIFGVSRDDIEVFEQKVTKSVNTGNILTVATINDFANPNQAATRTGFANDKTYFLLGDNNVTAIAPVAITIGGSAGQRIQRAWLSQRKNTPDALYFEADLSAYGASFAAPNNVLMLVADDAAFTTNVKSVTGTFTNGKWVFSNNFNTDNARRYITFAKVALSCTNPGLFDAAGVPSTTGISNLAGFTGGATGWPANVPNGHVVIESKNKGFVITRVSSSAAIVNPVEGMLIYDIADMCVKLYNGIIWNCLQKDCTN